MYLSQWTAASLLCIAVLFSSLSNALKFDLQASHTPGTKRCVIQYIGDNKLVVGNVNVADGENQRVDVEVYDKPHDNKYWNKRGVSGEQKFAFTTHDDAAVYFCFTNTLEAGQHPGPDTKLFISFHVDTGAEAMDLSEEIRQKKLLPVEVELRRLEAVATEITGQMEHLKEREMAMRDVNESTNSRVKWFNILAMGIVISSGVWQVMYLRRFFQAKKLI
ncbi:hypothetical protein SpCBS45565_g03688 [Spizellomyces sp. 'palustris']|nr:hypothetical protein SpCBS45565_g03688 [Spizellomyces sp. 'palustris']